jgi:hypothetical protein
MLRASSGEPLCLIECKAYSDEEALEALAWYGVYLPESSTLKSDMLLRFVEGHPVSDVTTTFLETTFLG